MKMLTLIVKPFRAEAVLAELAAMGFDEIVVREVKGYGRQKDYLNQYRGSEYSMAFLAKVEIMAAVPDGMADDALDRLTKVARTGRIGDGKVFVVPTVGDGIEC
jgi:nitrogen regulatory protein P-II 2